MGEQVIRRLMDPSQDDAAYIRQVAEVKRAVELWSMDPGFAPRFREDPAAALAEQGLSVDVLSVQILTSNELATKYNAGDREKIPLAARRYHAFIREKRADRDRMAREECVPTHPAFRAWRGRQLNRCWAELGTRNEALIHVPLTFELDLGCSVGCPFCGIAAPRLEKVARYDDETRALWRGILEYTKETIGPAAGSGTCYYATEPFDNPDYEKFTEDFFEVFGVVPQITTAAAMRRPERTRAYLEKTMPKYRRIHRFSVLSLDIMRRIFDYFTMEELLFIELLPQFPEAPFCRFANAGRARSGELKTAPESEGGTICCLSGFVVNLAERSIRMITPCGASVEHPTGEQIIARETFADLADFRRVLDGMMGRYMAAEFPKAQPLFLRPGLSFEATEEGIAFSRPGTMRLKFRGQDDLPARLYQEVLEKLREGGKSALDIAGELLDETGASPAHVFYLLKKFEIAGLFLEPYESEGR